MNTDSKLTYFSYSTLLILTETRESLRSVPDYEKKVGIAMFDHLFAMRPETKSIFGFSRESLKSSEDYKTRGFYLHAKYMIQTLDTALSMAGPGGSDILEAILRDLGEKHAQLGVDNNMFPAMAAAIVFSLENVSKQKWSPSTRLAWTEFLETCTSEMIIGANQSKQDSL